MDNLPGVRPGNSTHTNTRPAGSAQATGTTGSTETRLRGSLVTVTNETNGSISPRPFGAGASPSTGVRGHMAPAVRQTPTLDDHFQVLIDSSNPAAQTFAKQLSKLQSASVSGQMEHATFIDQAQALVEQLRKAAETKSGDSISQYEYLCATNILKTLFDNSSRMPGPAAIETAMHALQAILQGLIMLTETRTPRPNISETSAAAILMREANNRCLVSLALQSVRNDHPDAPSSEVMEILERRLRTSGPYHTEL